VETNINFQCAGLNTGRYDSLIKKYQTEHWSPTDLEIYGSFIRLDDIYLRSDSPNKITPNGNESALYFLLLIGGLVIIIAWVNYINLTTAKALQRAKEVGIRHAAGANWR
jgi:putative ABC transport system permease protein